MYDSRILEGQEILLGEKGTGKGRGNGLSSQTSQSMKNENQ